MIQLSVVLVGSQQGVHVYITAILLPYKTVVSTWKSYTFEYNIWTTPTQAGTQSIDGCQNTAPFYGLSGDLLCASLHHFVYKVRVHEYILHGLFSAVSGASLS